MYLRCQSDKLVIDDGVLPTVEKCGVVKPDLLFQSCSQQITLQYVTGASGSILYRGAKIYYESE